MERERGVCGSLPRRRRWSREGEKETEEREREAEMLGFWTFGLWEGERRE